MNFTGAPEANVEQMSNAELFQYLFKAELDSDMIPIDMFGAVDPINNPTSSQQQQQQQLHQLQQLQQQQQQQQQQHQQHQQQQQQQEHEQQQQQQFQSPPSSSSSLSPAPSFSTFSTSNSPETASLTFSPPAPYQQLNQTQHLLDLFGGNSIATYPTPLPSSSFSYRQISADMPPSMPTSLVKTPTEPQVQIQTQTQTQTQSQPQQPIAPSPSSTPSSSLQHQIQPRAQFLNAASASTPSSSAQQEQMSVWLQRFQQLQQIHHAQQHQLLSSTLYNNSTNENTDQTTSSNARSISPDSPPSPASSSSSSSDKRDKRDKKSVIYPSPPMKDDMSMDSDSDSGPSHSMNPDGSDPLKPSPSELKKMTSKERRQLRNKLSARNFRVRRKEYIGTLENQVKEARREAAELQKKLAQSELNCQFLRQELETARLSQTLFNDGRMSKEHANLLASLLNPNAESFPTGPASLGNLANIQPNMQNQQRQLMESINDNNMTILNNSLGTMAQSSTANLSNSTMDDAQGVMQPFVPFDGNWDVIVNRAVVPDPNMDPKEATANEDVYHKLLARYEAARAEAELDEQMRTELKAFNEQKLAQTYIVMPKEESMFSAAVDKTGQNSLLLQAMVYMMMVHLTRSLFEAATLSKDQLVSVYQTMDAPLRIKMMDKDQTERPQCKFAEWREAWIKKCWPSFYNNRRRVCELLKNGPCVSFHTQREVDVVETVRKMEEGVKGKTVEYSPFCLWLMSCIPDWMKCPDMLERERVERLAMAKDIVRGTEVSEAATAST
ncbi:hypothetical protein BG004_007244 [Podila humilis]|nr:hypothetical protein BG004_007244 [Podila humilis]